MQCVQVRWSAGWLVDSWRTLKNSLYGSLRYWVINQKTKQHSINVNSSVWQYCLYVSSDGIIDPSSIDGIWCLSHHDDDVFILNQFPLKLCGHCTIFTLINSMDRSCKSTHVIPFWRAEIYVFQHSMFIALKSLIVWSLVSSAVHSWAGLAVLLLVVR